MGMMDAAVAIYLLIYLGILVIICAVGYFRNFRGKTPEEIEEMTKPPSEEGDNT